MFHHNLGLALRLQSRDLEAMAAHRRALDLDPNHAEALAHLGQLLFQHGQPGEAAECYERAAKCQPDATLSAIYTAEMLIQAGRGEEAEACLQRALEGNPDSDLLHQVLGVLLQRLGHFVEANEALARAASLQPRRTAIYVSLVGGKKIGREDDCLIDGMRNLLRDQSLSLQDRSRVHFALGKAMEDLEEYEEAIKHFDRAHQAEAERMRQSGRSFDRRALKASIDQAMDGFTTEFFVRNRNAGSADDLPVFIIGMPRSGTTLVEQILSRHRQFGAGGELSYWSDMQGIAAEVLRATPPPESLRHAAERYRNLLRIVAPAARRVTDKMPGNFIHLGPIHLALPNARVIHVRRDARDVCLSIWSTPFGNPIDFAHDRGDLVFYYQQYARLMEHWRVTLPSSRLLEIQYESLVADSEPVARAMIEFCGLDWDDACLSPERSAHIIMTPSVWQARQPIYRHAAGRWRHYTKWLADFGRLRPSDTP
jgi:tetratricopeptide (TPR) repeat protein